MLETLAVFEKKHEDRLSAIDEEDAAAEAAEKAEEEARLKTPYYKELDESILELDANKRTLTEKHFLRKLHEDDSCVFGDTPYELEDERRKLRSEVKRCAIETTSLCFLRTQDPLMFFRPYMKEYRNEILNIARAGLIRSTIKQCDAAIKDAQKVCLKKAQFIPRTLSVQQVTDYAVKQAVGCSIRMVSESTGIVGLIEPMVLAFYATIPENVRQVLEEYDFWKRQREFRTAEEPTPDPAPESQAETTTKSK